MAEDSQPPYRIISCSRSSSSRWRFKTSSIIFLSSSFKWDRSGIGGRDGRRVADISPSVQIYSPPPKKFTKFSHWRTIWQRIFLTVSGPFSEWRFHQMPHISFKYISSMLNSISILRFFHDFDTITQEIMQYDIDLYPWHIQIHSELRGDVTDVRYRVCCACRKKRQRERCLYRLSIYITTSNC